jgi:hypothetical protein
MVGVTGVLTTVNAVDVAVLAGPRFPMASDTQSVGIDNVSVPFVVLFAEDSVRVIEYMSPEPVRELSVQPVDVPPTVNSPDVRPVTGSENLRAKTTLVAVDADAEANSSTVGFVTSIVNV